MALMPLLTIDELAAAVGLRPWHPDDHADLQLLTALLARRIARADESARLADGDRLARLLH